MIANTKSKSANCSFCGRSRDQVTGMVAGAPHRARGVPPAMVGKSVFICNECVSRFNHRIQENQSRIKPVIISK